jgi:transposase
VAGHTPWAAPAKCHTHQRPDHPLRTIKRFADRALTELWPTFDAMYGTGGGPSIAPKRLLKPSLLISLDWFRSQRAFCEELEYQLLWF